MIAQIILDGEKPKIRRRTFKNGESATQGQRITLDGVAIEGATIPLVDDHRDHQVEVVLV